MDGTAVNLIAESLMPGRSDVVRQMFNREGLRAPVIIWSPALEDLENPFLRRFAEIAGDWRDENGRVAAKDFDPDALGALQDWLMVVVPEHGDLRYARYGKGVQEHYGRDMTGQSVRAFGTYVADFFEGLYRAALARREWVMSEHEPPKSVFARAWRRLIIPLHAPDGEEVIAFAVLNVPENALRVGLDMIPDPVFVADAGGRMMYLNGAAQKMFGLGPISAPGQRLSDATGISLDDQMSPEELLTTGTVSESLELTVRGGIAERLAMTVGAAEHRGQVFYIVVMRIMTA